MILANIYLHAVIIIYILHANFTDKKCAEINTLVLLILVLIEYE